MTFTSPKLMRCMVASLFCLALTAAAAAAPPESSPARESDRTRWYREAKFGMFIHWSLYSLVSMESTWPYMVPGSEQITMDEKLYPGLIRQFNPRHYDPDAWVKLAKEAGQRYMVFTTKHHDGFAMFDSAFTDYKVTNTPYGKDVVAALAEAAHRENMPLGFYYSPPDMHHPAFRDTTKPMWENWDGEPTRPEWPLYLDYMELQLRELLTNYGKVSLVWFDGLRHQEKYSGQRFIELIHHLQPDALVNNRLGLTADFDTPEQYVPRGIPTKRVRMQGTRQPTDQGVNEAPPEEEFRLWETCMTINDNWGYHPSDQNFKSVGKLIRTLVDVVSKGGNFLLNVSPTPDGTIQPEFQERLRGVGKWMAVNGESIYGTTYGPWQAITFGRTTAKGKTIYLHVFEWPKGDLVVDESNQKIKSASLLDGGKSLSFRQSGKHLTIKLPDNAPDPEVSVIKLETE